MKIAETFISIQGEINVGMLAQFVRLSGCNLDCGFCDTPNAKLEGYNITPKELIEQCKHSARVVITGGEPFLQKEDLAKFVNGLKKINSKIIIEIETNGTIVPIQIKNYDNIIFNVSIKLKNSQNKYEQRISPRTITWHNDMRSNFKFVIKNEDDVDEVKMLVNEFEIPKQKIFLMPEGKTRDEQNANMLQVIQYAKINNYNFSPRFHILMWDTKKGV